MKAAVLGFVYGLLMPVFALFIGLQVSPLLANILLFPISAVSGFFELPLGMLSHAARLGLLVFSGVFWAAVFWFVACRCRKR